MRRIALIILFALIYGFAQAVNVSVKAWNENAIEVFRQLMEQTGKNFVYSSDLLQDVKVTVNVRNRSLRYALSEMFKDTDIEFSVKRNDVILKRKKGTAKKKNMKPMSLTNVNIQGIYDIEIPKMLEEVIVFSRLETPVIQSSEIGAMKISSQDIKNAPTIFEETDVIKTLHTQPGITEGTEGMAGMNVHGGNVDENMYMLDNVPLYHVNHFAGLFSAFNTDVIRYADFFKSSIPAKYDGRLSSFMDVRTKVGSSHGHHGSARLGLTSGSFNINGPLGENTTYSAAMRRSWYDVLTIPILAIRNALSDDEKTRFRYAFMDLNGKVNHRFSNRSGGFVSIYFGNDLLKTGSKMEENPISPEWVSDDKYDLHWGNFVVQTGFNYRLTPIMSVEFTAAYTKYFSDMKRDEHYADLTQGYEHYNHALIKTANNVNDLIFRGDFNWDATPTHRVRFGANYMRHSFLPQHTTRRYTFDDTIVSSKDSTWAYHANEANVYIEDDFKINDKIRINGGFHGTIFNIKGKTSLGYAPRLSVSYNPDVNWDVKVAYSRTNQFIHQLSHTYLSLPSDQWIPIMGNFKPENANKISFGGYWQSSDGRFAISVEGYYKDMRNLVEYRDEYYLRPPLEMWNVRLCSGSGTAKGIDFKLEKRLGNFTGHIAYTLAWTDRKFADKNGGKRFPARFDNRHTINILANWKVNERIQFNAHWTGHSGNRFTLLPQEFVSPDFGMDFHYESAPLRADINNYRLPFYHRLDMSLMVENKRGYWTFSLYNAYCHRNVIGVRRSSKEIKNPNYETDRREYIEIPVFQKISFLPILPSISYTWKF